MRLAGSRQNFPFFMLYALALGSAMLTLVMCSSGSTPVESGLWLSLWREGSWKPPPCRSAESLLLLGLCPGVLTFYISPSFGGESGRNNSCLFILLLTILLLLRQLLGEII